MSTCFHCSLPLNGSDITASINNKTQPFCCYGCQAIAISIHEQGLDSFYKFKDQPLQSSNQTQNNDFSHFDDQIMQADFVEQQGEQFSAQFSLQGLSCAACVWLIEHRLNQFDEVSQASVNLTSERLNIVWQNQKLSELMTAVNQLGFTIAPFKASENDLLLTKKSRQFLMRIVISGIASMQVMMNAFALYSPSIDEQYSLLMRVTSLFITLPVVLYAALPFYQACIRDIKTKHLTMDVPVAIAILLAFGASVQATIFGGGEVYYESVCMFTFFLLLGRYLEFRARMISGRQGNELIGLLPPMAEKITDDGFIKLSSKSLKVDDVVLVRPGAISPADGVIIKGNSQFDQALITGESEPILKKEQDEVIAGTTNLGSPVQVKVLKVGAQSSISSMIRLLDRAGAQKPKIVDITDAIAQRFVASVLVLSVLTFAGWWFFVDPNQAFWVSLSVLVVTCPCALSLAIPTALTQAQSTLRKHGLLISRGHVLSTLNQISGVVFDKTGTLTFGTPKIVNIKTNEDLTFVKRVAKSLEMQSEHPIAHAFNDIALSTFEVSKLSQALGQGVEGVINHTTYRLGQGSFVQQTKGLWLVKIQDNTITPIAEFELEDSLRPSAKPTIDRLQTLGLEQQILTGDPSFEVIKIAEQAGINQHLNAQSAEDKLNWLKAQQSLLKKWVMVGDGINDGPILAQADVSIAMAEGTALAQQQADALLLNSDLTVIAKAIVLAKKTQKIINQNLAWAAVYNLIALPLAISGLVTPWMAAIGMSASSLIVVLNALRLRTLN